MAKKVNEDKIKVVPASQPETGIDVNKTIVDDIIQASQIGGLDVSSIDALNTSAQTREQVYELIDSMAQDDVVSAVLETYAEDTIQTNDKGQTMWVESNDVEVLDYTTWLMDSLNIDKHLYQWAYCLVTYGDCYIRLYRKSDYGEDLLFKQNKRNQQLNEYKESVSKEPLTEGAKLRVYSEDDPYIPYVEMVPNPGEMFDLQKFGKSFGYIKAPIRVIRQTSDQMYNYLTHYKMKQKDVEIFDATCFVHACLENTNQRQPETVDIYLDTVKKSQDFTLKAEDKDYESEDSMTTSYSVKRGQSILFNSFRIWRELNLLEMSALLNRLTQSSVVRVLNVEVGDMPKEQVTNFMSRLKDKIEQKSALDVDKGMADYTNPGPIINTIYVPTHGSQGTVSAQTIGGDFDPKQLTDIEYFRDKLFGALKVPKQFFGFTEDGAGFNGGQSLTILSSRYGKSIKKLQNLLCQMVTDIINLFLIDRGLNNYVNKFTIRMQTPVTQEENDRRTNTDNRIRYVGDIMNQLGDVEDKATKLKIQKALLSDVVNDPEVIGYLQSYIEKLEAEAEKSNPESEQTESSEEGILPSPEDMSETNERLETEPEEDKKEILTEEGSEDTESSYLPTPEELGVDLTKE